MKIRIENKTVSKATNGGRYGGIGSVMQKRNGFDYLRICDVVTWKQFMIPHNVFFAQMDRWQRPDGSWKSQNNQGYKFTFSMKYKEYTPIKKGTLEIKENTDLLLEYVQPLDPEKFGLKARTKYLKKNATTFAKDTSICGKIIEQMMAEYYGEQFVNSTHHDSLANEK
jgi:lipopolysaccharide export LptBFGC system permease protein LptF